MEVLSILPISGLITATIRITEFAIAVNEVGSENDVFVRTIGRVRQDLERIEYLLAVDSVKSALSQNTQKLDWIAGAIRSTKFALDDIGLYVERVRSGHDRDGSITFGNRVRWVMQDRAKLENRRSELEVCHQTLTAVLVSLDALDSPSERRKSSSGSLSPVMNDLFPPPYEDSAADREFRPPHERRKSKLKSPVMGIAEIISEENHSAENFQSFLPSRPQSSQMTGNMSFARPGMPPSQSLSTPDLRSNPGARPEMSSQAWQSGQSLPLSTFPARNPTKPSDVSELDSNNDTLYQNPQFASSHQSGLERDMFSNSDQSLPTSLSPPNQFTYHPKEVQYVPYRPLEFATSPPLVSPNLSTSSMSPPGSVTPSSIPQWAPRPSQHLYQPHDSGIEVFPPYADNDLYSLPSQILLRSSSGSDGLQVDSSYMNIPSATYPTSRGVEDGLEVVSRSQSPWLQIIEGQNIVRPPSSAVNRRRKATRDAVLFSGD